MTAGLPGFGLGGVFFIISALVAPFGELLMTARGRSSRARWASVVRQFLMAVGMIAAIGVVLGLVGLVIGAGPVAFLSSFSLVPLGATTALLGFVVAATKLVQIGSHRAKRRARLNSDRRLAPVSETEAG